MESKRQKCTSCIHSVLSPLFYYIHQMRKRILLLIEGRVNLQRCILEGACESIDEEVGYKPTDLSNFKKLPSGDSVTEALSPALPVKKWIAPFRCMQQTLHHASKNENQVRLSLPAKDIIPSYRLILRKMYTGQSRNRKARRKSSQLSTDLTSKQSLIFP